MSRRRVEATPVTLTPEQEELFETVADVPDEAVVAVLRGHGTLLRHLEPDELRSLALVGAKEGIVSHEEEKGPLRKWVFFKALHKVLEHARDECKRNEKVLALVRAQAIVHWAHYHETVEIGVDDEATLTTKLHDASSGFYGRIALEMAAAEPPRDSNAEEDLGLRRAAAWAGKALEAGLGSLTPRERSILEESFRKEKPLTMIAAELGVAKPQYRTFVRDYDRLLVTLGRRLHALGMTGMPVWLPDVSGAPLGSEG